jgi:hypothetical protein
MLLSILVASGLALGARPDAGDAPRGRYLEARTASVFAGACHYGSEATTQGREALLAWRFEGGREGGVDLAGVELALALAGERNLTEPGARRAVVYLDGEPRAADAALRWLRREHAALLGAGEPAVVRAPIALTFEGDAYALEAGGRFALRGATLPDRACCAMPQAVWYRPFAAVDGALVGRNEVFRFGDPALGRTWSRSDENTGFAARFGPPPAAEAAR